MSEENEPFATAGSGKSDPEVAFELVSKLKGQGIWGERNMTAILDMYAECLDAVKGLRVYEGQNRVEVPITKASPKNAAQQAPTQPAPKTAAATTETASGQAPGAQQQAAASAQLTPPQQMAQQQAAQMQAQRQAQMQAAQHQQTQQAVHAQQQALQQAYKTG